MKPTDDPFDDALRDRFAVGGPTGFGADPGPLAFDRIRAELALPGTEPVPPRRARWGRTAASLLALLLVGTGLGERLFTPPGKRSVDGTSAIHQANRPGSRTIAVNLRPAPAAKPVLFSTTPGQSLARVQSKAHRPAAEKRSYSNEPGSRHSGGFANEAEPGFLPKKQQADAGNTLPTAPGTPSGFVLNPLRLHAWARPTWVMPVVVSRPVPAFSRRTSAGQLAWFGTVTGQYAYANLMPNPTDDGFVRHVQSAGRFAPGRLGWRAQVGFEKPVLAFWSLRLSLVFNQLNQKFSYVEQTSLLDSVATHRLDPNSVTVQSFYQTRPGRTEFRQQFAGLNAAVLRRFGESFYALAGGEVGLAWGTTGRQPTVALTAGLGVSRPVGGGWSLRVEPTLRFSTRAYQTTDGRFGWRPYTIGLAVGLQKQGANEEMRE